MILPILRSLFVIVFTKTMPDELVPKPEEPVKFDQISGSLESQQPVVHFPAE